MEDLTSDRILHILHEIKSSELPPTEKKELTDFLKGVLNAIYSAAHNQNVAWAKGISASCQGNNAVADFWKRMSDV